MQVCIFLLMPYRYKKPTNHTAWNWIAFPQANWVLVHKRQCKISCSRYDLYGGQFGTLIGLPKKIRAFPIWIARAASAWVLYLIKPNPLSLCMRTSSITPAPRRWKCWWRSAELTCKILFCQWKHSACMFKIENILVRLGKESNMGSCGKKSY